MKRAAALISFLGLVGIASAATITVTNVNTPSSASTVLVNGAGTAQISGGFVGIGSFKITDDAIKAAGSSGAATILAGFNQLGNAFASGLGANGGLYRNTVTGAIASGDNWSGKNVYTVIGTGGNSLASSTAVVVFKHTQTFVDDPGATADALMVAGKGDLLTGNATTGAINFAGNAAYSNVVRVGVIPEPSSALLLLSGLVVAFRRRK